MTKKSKAEYETERELIFSRWRRLCMGRRTLGNLVKFHTQHKYQILAHSPKIYRDLGRLVARGKELPEEELFPKYRQLLTQAMDSPTSHGKHLNVLQHMAGYFRSHLSEAERQTLRGALEAYRDEKVSLSDPLNLIHWLAQRHELGYLTQQTYLSNVFSG